MEPSLGLRQNPVNASQQRLLGLWTREFPFKGYLLPYYQMLTKAILMTEGHKRFLKPEIPIASRVILKKHSNEDRNAQTISMIKWKRFI